MKKGVLITKEEFENTMREESVELATELAFLDGFEPEVGYISTAIMAQLTKRVTKKIFKEERKGE